MKTGTADTPLHGGKAPKWLFSRMTSLSREIVRAIVEEYGPIEVLRRLSNPHWFQAFGCVIGFDWHSSGVTTTTLGALKEGLKDLSDKLNIFVAGGKGGISRKTPDEIVAHCKRLDIDPLPIVYASRMSAKVDSTVLQDGYQIYAHSMIFTGEGDWAVVQQGMNESLKYARRYHWIGEGVKSFVVEPHSAIITDKKSYALDLTSKKSEGSRMCAVDIIKTDHKQMINNLREVIRLTKGLKVPVQGDLFDNNFKMPSRHWISFSDIRPDRLKSVLLSTYERQPGNFEELVGLEGVGAKTLRALALMGEVIYGESPSFDDPARFSYAVGGKDGQPYPVQKKIYDESILLLKEAVNRAGIGQSDKKESIKRLSKYYEV